MKLIEETNVPDDVLPLERFKAHLRLGTALGETEVQDEILLGFLRAAMAAVEARCGKVLVTRSFTLCLSRWHDREGQVLPVAPVNAIEAVRMITGAGVETELPLANFRLEQDSQRPRLRPTTLVLPMIPTGGSVQVRFTAGYGDAWQALPADLTQAVLLLASHYFEYRDEMSLSEGCMPFGVSSLVQRYRPMRLSPGART